MKGQDSGGKVGSSCILRKGSGRAMTCLSSVSRRKVRATLMRMASKIMSHERHKVVSLHIRCVWIAGTALLQALFRQQLHRGCSRCSINSQKGATSHDVCVEIYSDLSCPGWAGDAIARCLRILGKA